MTQNFNLSEKFDPKATAVVFEGDCLNLLPCIPTGSIQLIITSPPYNIGKEYEKRLNLSHYVESQKEVITECYRVLKPTGSICWQVGNYVDKKGGSS